MASENLVKWLRGAEEGGVPGGEASAQTSAGMRARLYLPRGVVLRDYQLEAIAAWLRAGKRGVVVLPTGTGKTFVGSAVAYQYARVRRRVVVLVPTQQLAHQWAEHFRKYYLLKCGIWHAESKEEGVVTVIVYNSAIGAAARVVEAAELVVIDEVHHFGAEKLYALLRSLRGKSVLGLTATLSRSDGRHVLVQALLPVVYSMSLEAAARRGAVAATTVMGVPVLPSIAVMAEYERLTREIARYKSDYEGMGSQEAFRRMMILVNKRKQLLSLLPEKMRAVLEIARREEGKRVLVFTESIESAETVARLLRENGIPAEVYHSLKPLGERQRILRRWGAEARVLVAVRALDEGVDVPECEVGVIMSTGTTRRQLVQRVGRVIRPRPGKVARIYVVYARGTHEEQAFRLIARWFSSR